MIHQTSRGIPRVVNKPCIEASVACNVENDDIVDTPAVRAEISQVIAG